MRGLARLEAQGVSIPHVVTLRDHHHPVRTEADAWREIIRDRRARGLPLTYEEHQEAGAAFDRERGTPDRILKLTP
jgi:hypothetical protein